jgi:hypothetical protein
MAAFTNEDTRDRRTRHEDFSIEQKLQQKPPVSWREPFFSVAAFPVKSPR